jgi:hypothetical protein
VATSPAPKPAASPTPTRESMLAIQPRATPALSHLGPAALYPNQELTQGKADTLDVSDLTRRYTDNCPRHKQSCTYSKAHRNVPQQVHSHVYDEYNVPDSERNSTSGEVDHFWPLCAGGSNDISNLWYQPAQNEWQGENLGYHEKDWLEDQIANRLRPARLIRRTLTIS